MREEWEKIKHEPAKIKEFYKKHRDIIDLSATLAGIGGISTLYSTGTLAESPSMIALAVEGMLWGGKQMYEEKRKYGLKSIWEAGEYGARRKMRDII